MVGNATQPQPQLSGDESKVSTSQPKKQVHLTAQSCVSLVLKEAGNTLLNGLILVRRELHCKSVVKRVPIFYFIFSWASLT